MTLDASVDSTAAEEVWRAGILGLPATAWPPYLSEDFISSASVLILERLLPPRGSVADTQSGSSLVPTATERLAVDRQHRNIALSQVRAARQPEEIVEILSLEGCSAAAERIQYLHELNRDGAPDEPPIVLSSLRELAFFLISQRHLARPKIALMPDGLMLAEWSSPESGVLDMNFLPDGMIQFAAVSAAGRGGSPLRVSGRLPRDRALAATRAFLPVPEPPESPA